jgi:hypothetical protein
MCLRVRGEATEKTTTSSSRATKPNNASPNDSREPQKNSLLYDGLRRVASIIPTAGGDLLLLDSVFLPFANYESFILA